MEAPLDFTPLGRRVMVKRKKPDLQGFKMTAELEREGHPDQGVILKVGDIGWANRAKGIVPGALICFTRYSPVTIRDGEDEFIFVELDNILGIQS